MTGPMDDDPAGEGPTGDAPPDEGTGEAPAGEGPPGAERTTDVEDAAGLGAPDGDADQAEGGSDDAEDEEDEEEPEADEEEPRSRLRTVAAILAIVSGLLLAYGLFLPYAGSGGTENPGLTIDFSQPSWIINVASLGIPVLVVLTGLAVLGELMRPSVGSGVVTTAAIARLLTTFSGLAFLAMVPPTAGITLSTGFYVLGLGGLVGLVSGAILLAVSRRGPGG